MASTKERLADLVSLSAAEREELSEDLAVEFELADEDADASKMADALAGLESLDKFEKLVEQLTEKLSAKVDAAEDAADEAITKAETVDKPNESDKDTPADAPADKAEDAPADDTDSTETDDKKKSKDKDEKAPETPGDKPADAPADAKAPEAEAPAEGATSESEVTAMAAAVVTDEDKAAEPGKEVAPLVASVSVTARAGAEVDGYTPGEAFRTTEDIAEAMSKRIDASRGMGDGLKSIVASLRSNIPEERQLSNGDPFGNQEKIEAVRSEQAIVASGGFCAPLPVNYDIFGVGSTARPVRDSLPTFGATRGGIRFIQPPVLGSYGAAISLWTAINDANPTSPVTKPVLKVNCANELTASTDAITLSLEFGNLMTRAFPELVQRHNQLALIEHARFAEKTLLSKISALSNKVTVAAKLGTARDLLNAVAVASAQYRNRHRIPRGVNLRLLMPDWTLDAIREDIASNLRIENVAVSDSVVRTWFSARGFTISWYMDDTFAAQTNNAALNNWPALIKFWVFAEGTLLFLDGGTLDLGVIRDAELVSTNDYVTFVETFEGLAKVGIEVLEVAVSTSTGPIDLVTTP